MRVAIVLWCADAARGGAERYAFELAASLRARGHDARLVHAGPASADGILGLDLRGWPRTRRYGRFCRAWTAARRAHEFDVAHAMLPVPDCDVYDAMAGFESLTLRTVPPWKRRLLRKRLAFAAVERASMARTATTLALALSDREREAALREFGCAEDRIVTRHLALGLDLPSGFDREVERRQVRGELGIGEGATTLLFVGNDFRRKGLDVALAAFDRARREGLDGHLVVAGQDGRDGARFASSAASVVPPGRVHFLGLTEDVRRLYAAADLLLLPAVHEPFGMVVTEAMSLGCASIVSRTVGAAEVIRPGVDGVVLASRDPGAWADAIRHASTPAALRAMRARCDERREELSRARHFDRIASLHESIVARRSHAP